MLVRGKYILTSAEPEEIFDGAFRVKDGVISEEQVSLESLGRGFGPLQKQVN